MAWQSKHDVLLLLLYQALAQTDREHPRNTRELKGDVAALWTELFPGESAAGLLSESSVQRHIQDIRASGLLDIATHREKQRGYFRAAYPFSATEMLVIAASLCRLKTVSVPDTERLLGLLERFTDSAGKEVLREAARQLGQTRYANRKTTRAILPVIGVLASAISHAHQVMFWFYENDAINEPDVQLRRDENGKPIRHRVDPYFIACVDDSLYLIGHEAAHDQGRPHLSQYKITRIHGGVRECSSPAWPLDSLEEYAAYGQPLKAATPEVDDASEPAMRHRQEARRAFRLDLFLLEHVRMWGLGQEVATIRLSFPENLKGAVLAQWGLDARQIEAYRTGGKTRQRTPLYSAVIRAELNEGLYGWLMQYSDELTVIDPSELARRGEVYDHAQAKAAKIIRAELRRRHKRALAIMERRGYVQKVDGFQ